MLQWQRGVLLSGWVYLSICNIHVNSPFNAFNLHSLK
uniref:Uncharacterized protein n=1 Tax=Rhizophora mucronata TaxID=61149 RepID=A0A2P2P6S4_RHIMU